MHDSFLAGPIPSLHSNLGRMNMSWTIKGRGSVGALLLTSSSLIAAAGWAAPIIVIEDYALRGGSNDAGINFAIDYGANTPTGATWTDDPTVPYGSSRGLFQSPFHSNELTATNSYFSVGGPIAANDPTLPASPSPASLIWSAGDEQSSISVLWGSIDIYNVLNLKNNGALVYTLTGTAIANFINSTFGTSLTASSSGGFGAVALVSIALSGGSVFDELQFVSTAAAFEFALDVPPPISTLAIPTPANGLMFGMVLAGLALGCGLRLRQTDPLPNSRTS
jgi:hypothetical protein